MHQSVHARYQEAKEAGVTLIDEYLFPHGIFQINPSDMNPEGLKFAYGRIAQYLGIQKN